jgi:hypothetical protein
MSYGLMIQRIKVSTKLGREELYELGRRGPYFRYVTEPEEWVELTECMNLDSAMAKLMCSHGHEFEMTSAEVLKGMTGLGGLKVLCPQCQALNILLLAAGPTR